MMKYKGTYIRLIPIFLRRYLAEQYGKELTKDVLRKAPHIYRRMLEQTDDIGFENPMADNIYMGFVFMAIWKAADGKIDIDSYRSVIKRFMGSSVVQKMIGGPNLNDPQALNKAKEKFRANKRWADEHPEYKDKTWDFNFDDSKHKDGTYYHFTRCPLNDFARKYGFLEILPVCCEMDYMTIAARHAVLHRDHTLAAGGNICDYWIVPDKIKDPE